MLCWPSRVRLRGLIFTIVSCFFILYILLPSHRLILCFPHFLCVLFFLFCFKQRYTSRLHLMPEVDGLRIISEDKHELLQAVPESVEKIFQLGFSRHPGAMLYMARQGYA